MTVYVTDGEGCGLFLWADTDDEATLAAGAVGLWNPPAFREWWAYVLNWEQWARAVMNGATVTDRWEPALQYARRTGGREGLIEAIERQRLRT